MWKSIKDAAVIERLKDEAAHAEAMHEMSTGKRRDGLWAKAIIQSNGDDKTAKILYLKFLVEAIKDDIYIAGRTHEDSFESTPKKTQDNVADKPTQRSNNPTSRENNHKEVTLLSWLWVVVPLAILLALLKLLLA